MKKIIKRYIRKTIKRTFRKIIRSKRIIAFFLAFTISLSFFNLKKVYATSNDYNYIRYLPLKEQLKFSDEILKQVYSVKDTRVAIVDDILYFALGSLILAFGINFIHDFQAKEIGRAIWWEFTKLGGALGEIIVDVGEFLKTHTINITSTLRKAIDNVIDSYDTSIEHVYSVETTVSDNSVGSINKVNGSISDIPKISDFFAGQVVYKSSRFAEYSIVTAGYIFPNGSKSIEGNIVCYVNQYFTISIENSNTGLSYAINHYDSDDSLIYTYVFNIQPLKVILNYGMGFYYTLTTGSFVSDGTLINSITVPPVEVGDAVKDNTILKPGSTVTIPNEETIRDNVGSLSPDNTLTWDKVGATVTEDTVTDDTVTDDTVTDGTLTGVGESILNPTFDKTLDFSPLYIDLSKKFPFSIPWDFYNLFKDFEVSKKRPVVTYTFPEKYFNSYELTIDFAFYDDIFPFTTILRYFLLISFVYILIIKTRNLIGG